MSLGWPKTALKHAFLWRYLHEIVSIVIDDAMSCSIMSAKNEIKNTKNKSFIGNQQSTSGEPDLFRYDRLELRRGPLIPAFHKF